MWSAFIDYDGKDGQRQQADYDLSLNRVAFFFLSSRLSGF